MTMTNEYFQHTLTKLRRVVAMLRELRADAELAGRASTIAQLSRRNGGALRELYVRPRAESDSVLAPRPPSSASAGPRLEWIGQLGATAVAVCLLLVVVVIAVVVPHAA